MPKNVVPNFCGVSDIYPAQCFSNIYLSMVYPLFILDYPGCSRIKCLSTWFPVVFCHYYLWYFRGVRHHVCLVMCCILFVVVKMNYWLALSNYITVFNCTNIYKFLFYIFMKARIGSILFVGLDPEPWSEIPLPQPLSHYIDVKMLPPSSGKETEFHIEPELTLELMMAANYLHTWVITSLPSGWQVLLNIVSIFYSISE